jgi:predicted N-acetyltransferase YhbS
MPALSIRLATVEDAAAISGLSQQLGYAANATTIRERLTRILGEDDSCVQVAISNGEIVGWIHAAIVQLVESVLRAEIGGLVVDETHYRKGIGRQLISAVEVWAIEKGAEEVSVKCNTKRVDAHLFYQALNFTQIKTQITFRKQLVVPPAREV